jgi:hypothetical protein
MVYKVLICASKVIPNDPVEVSLSRGKFYIDPIITIVSDRRGSPIQIRCSAIYVVIISNDLPILLYEGKHTVTHVMPNSATHSVLPFVPQFVRILSSLRCVPNSVSYHPSVVPKLLQKTSWFQSSFSLRCTNGASEKRTEIDEL